MLANSRDFRGQVNGESTKSTGSSSKRTSSAIRLEWETKTIKWIGRILILMLLFNNCMGARRRIQRGRAIRQREVTPARLQNQAFMDSSRRRLTRLRPDDSGDQGEGRDANNNENLEISHHLQLNLNWPFSLRDEHQVDPDLVDMHIRNYPNTLAVGEFMAIDERGFEMRFCGTFNQNYDAFREYHDELTHDDLDRLSEIWPTFTDQTESQNWLNNWVRNTFD